MVGEGEGWRGSNKTGEEYTSVKDKLGRVGAVAGED